MLLAANPYSRTLKYAPCEFASCALHNEKFPASFGKVIGVETKLRKRDSAGANRISAPRTKRGAIYVLEASMRTIFPAHFADDADIISNKEAALGEGRFCEKGEYR